MTAYVPEHNVKVGMLAARIYEGWIVSHSDYVTKKQLQHAASAACDAAAVLMTELRRRDPITGERIHGDVPFDVEDDNDSV